MVSAMNSSSEELIDVESMRSAAKAVVASPMHRQTDRNKARMRLVILENPFQIIYSKDKYVQMPSLFHLVAMTR